MIRSTEGRSSGVLSILQDSVFPSAVYLRSLFRFGEGRVCVEDKLEDVWFHLDIRQLFYAPNITFRTLHSSQANKDYVAPNTHPSAILLVLRPRLPHLPRLPHFLTHGAPLRALCAKKKQQGNQKEKLTESLHLTVKIARSSNYNIDVRKLRINKITDRRNHKAALNEKPTYSLH